MGNGFPPHQVQLVVAETNDLMFQQKEEDPREYAPKTNVFLALIDVPLVKGYHLTCSLVSLVSKNIPVVH